MMILGPSTVSEGRIVCTETEKGSSSGRVAPMVDRCVTRETETDRHPMDRTSPLRASRDLAAYVEKREAQMVRAREIRTARLNNKSSDVPGDTDRHPRTNLTFSPHRGPPTPTKVSKADLVGRVIDLEEESRVLKEENARLRQQLDDLAARLDQFELRSARTVSDEGQPPLRPSLVKHDLDDSSAAPKRKQGRNVRKASPPPMDFSIDPYDDDDIAYRPPPVTAKRDRGKPRRKHSPPAMDFAMGAPGDDKPTEEDRPSTKRQTHKPELPVDIPIRPAAGPIAVEDDTTAAPQVLHPCKTCGRSFRAESLAKHSANCIKVFHSKRKAFKVEVLSKEDAASLRLAQRSAPASTPTKSPGRAVPKWRQDRERLRRAMKTTTASGDARSPGAAIDDGRVPCPHCARMFSAMAADRHIPICLKTKHRPSTLVRKHTAY